MLIGFYFQFFSLAGLPALQAAFILIYRLNVDVSAYPAGLAMTCGVA